MTSTLANIKSSKRQRPRRTLLAGVSGVGKTTFASKWPNPIFLPCEEGQDHIDVPSFPLATDYLTVGIQIIDLIQDPHDFQTLVIDTVDWLEKLIWKHVAAKASKASIADIGFGKGYKLACESMGKICEQLDQLRNERGMHILLLAHSEIKRYNDPDGEAYDRHVPKLHDQSSALLFEWSDEVLFAAFKTYVEKEESGFGKQRSIGRSTGERVLYTVDRPNARAKNRMQLPPEIPMDFSIYQTYLNGTAGQAQQINGMAVDPAAQAAQLLAAQQAAPPQQPAQPPPASHPGQAPTTTVPTQADTEAAALHKAAMS